MGKSFRPQTRMPQTFNQHKAVITCLLTLVLAAASAPSAQTLPARRVAYIPYEEARPIVEAASEILPPELSGKSPSELAPAWPAWAARRDAEIRARLAQGDEDTLVNFLLFGTSYTRQPRITQKQLQQIGQQQTAAAAGADGNAALKRLADNLQARADDLIKALAAPGSNDRLLFARRLLAGQKGFRLEAPEGRAQAKAYLLASVVRVLSELGNYAKALEAARLQGADEEFMERSRLFSTRGLSSDTSLMPNYAIEEALKAIQGRKLLADGGVRRVAIIGPGLDFTDKQEGYDFYPQQSIQPFAVIDSLLRLGLARADRLQVTTFDLSPRVNDHLERARLRAQGGQAYTLQLPYDAQAPWKPEALRYWEHFGDMIGAPAAPIAAPPGAGSVKMRAVRVRPSIVSLVTPMDLNIVLQRLETPPSEGFDLIVATNILVYYDAFEQSLAMANIERMLRPGGFLLSNNALVELPSSRVRSVDYSTVVYSDRPGDGDHIVWYQRAAG